MTAAIRTIKKAGTLAATISMISLVLSGCSAMSGGSSDKDDVCATQRAAFASAEQHYGLSIAAGAVGGALLGAGAAALISAAQGGNIKKNVAIGAGAGALAGGIGGYFVEKKRTTPDPQALAGAIQSDVVAENAQIDKATVAFIQLRQCRFAAADQVKADFAAGRISREEAVRRLNTLKTEFDADVATAEQMGVKMTDKSKEFQYASNQLVDANPQARAAIGAQAVQDAPPAASGQKQPAQKKDLSTLPPTSKAVVETAQVSQTNLIKSKGFGNEVVQAKADAASEFSLQGTVGEVSHGTEVC